MEDKTNINQFLTQNDDSNEFEFKYNFISTPWDDRTNSSKVGIVALLITIFTATMAGVANSFAMHYRGYSSNKNMRYNENNCFRVKTEEYRFVARIFSASSKELLCVGAVVSPTSILANAVCVKSEASEPIRINIGSPTDPYCKKGFSVANIEPVSHNALNKLVLLSTFENMNKCAQAVRIGTSIDWKLKVDIIGKPLMSIGRSLSRQLVTLKGSNIISGGKKIVKIDNTICVKDLARCSVGVGDLLVQNGELYGLATTSNSSRNKLVCFDDLDAVRNKLSELDATISA